MGGRCGGREGEREREGGIERNGDRVKQDFMRMSCLPYRAKFSRHIIFTVLSYRTFCGPRMLCIHACVQRNISRA